jgi:hypothetical protein
MKTLMVVAVAGVVFGALGCGNGGGGGTGGGSAGGGSGGGAGGTSGGGSGSSASGIITFAEVGFSTPVVVASADGAVHLVYTFGTSPAHLVYRRCQENCDRPGQWQGVDLALNQDDLASNPHLAVASDGRVHVVWAGGPLGGAWRTYYATCTSNCIDPASWSRDDISAVFPNTGFAFRGDPMVLDATGRLWLVTSTLSYNATVALSTCPSNCTSVASWESGVIRTGGSRASLAAHGTTLHLVLNNEASALVYRTCSSNCTQEASWQESPPLFAHGETPPVSLTATASGGLRLAYNQGTASNSESAQVKMQNDRLLVWSCDANCLVAASWKGLVLGDVSDGQDGLGLTSLGESLGLVVTTSAAQTMTARLCDANCTDGASWKSAVLDSSRLMNAAIDPYESLGCTDSNGNPARANFAGWYPYEPALALSPSGAATFVHAPYILRTCSVTSGTTRLPGVGRLVYLK